MSCWCKEVPNYVCINCERTERFNKLNQQDRGLIEYFAKHYQRPALRNIINEFEKRKGDWTDFAPDALIEANANQK